MNKYSRIIVAAAVFLISPLAHAQTEGESEAPPTVAELMTLARQACPAIWESLEVDIDMQQAPADVWQGDADDRGAFVSYLETILASETSGAENANALADDLISISAECHVRRVDVAAAILNRAPDEIAKSISDAQGFMEGLLGSAGPDGTSAEQAAASCKAIKEAHPNTESGVYWVDVTGEETDDALQVFCEMETDGGGWTLVVYVHAYSNADLIQGNLFAAKVGTLDLNRGKGNTGASTASDGLMNKIDDTEMMITLDGADPEGAKQANKFIRYRYDKNALAFNYGPFICQPSAFTYSLELDGSDEQIGEWSACSDTRYYMLDANGARTTSWYNGSDLGTKWGSGMGGNDTWNHHAWIYIR